MASTGKTGAPSAPDAAAPTYFDRQRAALVQEIGVVGQETTGHHGCRLNVRNVLTRWQSLERVLQNFNKLNRTLEGVIDVRLSVNFGVSYI